MQMFATHHNDSLKANWKAQDNRDVWVIETEFNDYEVVGFRNAYYLYSLLKHRADILRISDIGSYVTLYNADVQLPELIYCHTHSTDILEVCIENSYTTISYWNHNIMIGY